jgi:hypothetical protein
VVTHSVHSTLNSIGGIQVLFPLFAQLDLPSADWAESAGEAAGHEANEGSKVAALPNPAKDQSLW